MQASGVTTRAELAFYFSSRQEAESEAGVQVAAAWELARSECQKGLAAQVRDLFLSEALPTCSSASSMATSFVSLAPPARGVRAVRAPRVKGGVCVQRSALPLVEANAKHRPVMVEVLRKASRFVGQLSAAEGAAVVDAAVDPILASAEEVTLRKVARTWAELCAWAQQNTVELSALSAVHVAQFVLTSKAKSRVLPALVFMRKHLHFAPDLGLTKAFRSARSGGVGLGAKQAPVAQPAMLLSLEQQIVASCRNRNPDWLGLFATWCQATGCVRLVHVQRSRLVQLDQRTMLFECVRGKQRTCPRFSIAESVDFGGMFLEALQKQSCPSLIQCVAFRATSGEEIAPSAVRSVVGLAMSAVLPPEEACKVSSKCWRQVPVTLSLLGGLDPTEVCALGNWLDKGPSSRNVMPWRYHRAKLRQTTELKHHLRFVLREILLAPACAAWEDVDTDVIRDCFRRARVAVAAQLKVQPQVQYQWQGPRGVRGEQAFRLRRSSLSRLQKGLAPTLSKASERVAGCAQQSASVAAAVNPALPVAECVSCESASPALVVPEGQRPKSKVQANLRCVPTRPAFLWLWPLWTVRTNSSPSWQGSAGVVQAGERNQSRLLW